MEKVFVDTNIIIDFTKGFGKNLKELIFLQKRNHLQVFVNSIVIAEFFNEKNLNNKKSFELANRLFQFFEVMDIGKNIGLLAGELLRTNQVNFLADALIAATCLKHNLLLATNNKKDFRKTKGLNFYK